MMPGPASHGVARALFDLSLAAWVLSELGQRFRRRTDATSADRGSTLFIAAIFGAALILAALARKVGDAAFPLNWATFALGFIVLWLGIGLRWWSFLTLGRYFTVEVMTSPDQPVITAGPYRFVRHPSYTALLLAFAGIGIVDGNWLSLLALIALPLIALLNRIRVEEAALSASLGERYRAYAATHNRLIPGVW
jgi:protein-S-isoprenylcysteine O-methyltransferase Ste14